MNKAHRKGLYTSLKARGANGVIEDWKNTKYGRGERCRKEIRRFKSKDIENVTVQMDILENKINQKLKDLENEILEVEEEVEGVVGHWDFQDFLQRETFWKNELKRDYDFRRSMFQNLSFYVEQEIEDFYVSVVQELKDLGIKLGDEIEPDDGIFHFDEELKKPYYCGKMSNKLRERNVILK